MGGGLNFLNKKTWHPARPQNLEEVWKREQKAAAEAKKAEELRKQLEEERKRSEFVQMAMDTGHLRKEERLDWMYGSGLQAKQDAEKRREDMLTGKADVVLPPEQRVQETSRAEQVSQLPSFYAQATPASQNETWLRLNNDPLFAIKRQQQEQLSKLKENPVKMMELLKSLSKATGKEGKKEKKGKKDKKEKKDKKSRKRERGSDSSDDEGGSDGGRQKRSRSPPGGLPPPPLRSGGPDHDRPGPSRPRGADSAADYAHAYGRPQHPSAAGHRGRSRSRSRSRSPAGRREAPAGAGYPGRSGGRHHHGDHHHHPDSRPGDQRDARGDEGRGWDRREYDGDHREYDREYDRRGDDDDRRRDGGGGAGAAAAAMYDRDRDRQRDHDRHRDAERERGREQQERDGGDRDGHRGRPDRGVQGGEGYRSGGREERPAEREAERERGRERGSGGGAEERRGGGSSPGRHHGERQVDDRYGLKHSSAAPEALRQVDTGSRAAETRARLEEARRVREEEERAKAAQRYVRKDFKTGQISEEERQRRLAEMMGNADEHETQRRRRLEAAAAVEAAEGSQRLVHQADTGRGGDAFRDAASRDVYSKLQGSLEARVNSRRHFSAR